MTSWEYARRVVNDAEDAEMLAARYMRRLGRGGFQSTPAQSLGVVDNASPPSCCSSTHNPSPASPDAGIDLRGARNVALRQLVPDMPPAIAADTLGYTYTTTERHARDAGTNWATYPSTR